jgi:hypothetical protein
MTGSDAAESIDPSPEPTERDANDDSEGRPEPKSITDLPAMLMVLAAMVLLVLIIAWTSGAH